MLNTFLQEQVDLHLGGSEKIPDRYLVFFDILGKAFAELERERDAMQAITADLMREHFELKTIFESIENVFFTVDMVLNKTTRISPACLAVYGYPQEAFYQNVNLWYELILPEDRHIVDSNFSPLLEGRKITQEYRILCVDGSIKWLESKLTPTMQNGKPVRIDGITTDITARKTAEQRTLHSESRFRHLIEKSHDVIVLLGAGGKITYTTPSVKRVLGYEPNELLDADPQGFIHPDDIDHVTTLLQSLLPRFGESTYAVYRMCHKKGHWCYMASSITNMLHEPSVNAIVFNYEDITERIRAQNQLEFDRRNRDALINSTSDLMWSLDTDMRLITANQAFLHTLQGLTGRVLITGDSMIDFTGFPEAERLKWAGRYQRVLAGEPFKLEDYTLYPSEAWYEVSFNPIIENNRVIGASCFSRDVTEHKRSMRLVRKSEEMMAEAERIAQLGSWEMDLTEEKKLHWSEEVYRILGVKPGNFNPSFNRFLAMVHTDDMAAIQQKLGEVLVSQTTYTAEFRVVRPDNNIRWVRASGDVVKDSSTGRLVKLMGTMQDITERKYTEEERTRITNDLIQKNKDLEQFTYIISHNLRAPVVNIQGLIHLIQNHGLDKAAYNNCLRGLDASAKRLDEMIIDLNRILQVRNGLTEKKERVRLGSLISDIRETLQLQFEQNRVELVTDFAEVPYMYSVKSYLYSIFYNLVSNSIKYSRKDVVPEIKVTSKLVNGKIVLTFKDNGSGIDLKKHGDKVFGLYKRFHTNVEGKGMGLFMVKTQVESLGGTVKLESEVNQGVKFILEFVE